MKNFLLSICLLIVTSAVSQAATIIGNLATATGNSAVNYVRFVPPKQYQAYGTNTIICYPIRANTDTNNNFSINTGSAGGFYDANFGNDPTLPPLRVLIPPNNTNTYTLNQVAQLAVNASMFGLGSVTITNLTSDLTATNLDQQATNQVNSLALYQAQIVVSTNQVPISNLPTNGTWNFAGNWLVSTNPDGSGGIIGAQYISALGALASPNIVATGAGFIGNGAGITNIPNIVTNTAQATIYPQIPYVGTWFDASIITGVADGQPLASVPDISGNGNTLKNAAESNVLYSATGLNGMPAINFPAPWSPITNSTITYGYALTNGIWFPQMTNNFCFFLVPKDNLELGGNNSPVLLNGGQRLFMAQFGTNAQEFISSCDGTFGGPHWTFAGGGNNEILPVHRNHEPFVICIGRNNQTNFTYFNGVKVFDENLSGPFPANSYGTLFTLGNIFNNTAGIQSPVGAFDGLMAEGILCTNFPGYSAINSVNNYLLRKYRIGGGVMLGLIGDSIMQGRFASFGSNFTTLVQIRLPSVQTIPEAIPGAVSAQILSYSNWVYALPPNSSGQKVDVLMIGANDIHNNISFSTYTNNVTLEIAWLHANNHRVIICTLPSLVWETGFTMTRAQINAWIYSTGQYLADGLCDFAADPVMGYTGAYTNAICFNQGDQVHPLGPGYVQLMTELVPALQKLLYGVSATSIIALSDYYAIQTNLLNISTNFVSPNGTWTNLPNMMFQLPAGTYKYEGYATFTNATTTGVGGGCALGLTMSNVNVTIGQNGWGDSLFNNNPLSTSQRSQSYFNSGGQFLMNYNTSSALSGPGLIRIGGTFTLTNFANVFTQVGNSQAQTNPLYMEAGSYVWIHRIQ